MSLNQKKRYIMKNTRFLVFILTIATLVLSACGAAATPSAGSGKVEAMPVAFVGTVDGMAGDQWVINGTTVTVDPAVVRDGPFTVGDRVKVEGIVNTDGSLTVSRVEVASPEDATTLPAFGDANTNDTNANDNANINDGNINDDNSNINDGNINDDNSNGLNSNDDDINDDNSNGLNSNDDDSNDDNGNGVNSNDDDSNDDNGNSSNSNSNDDDSDDDNGNGDNDSGGDDDNGGNSNDD